MPEQKEAIARKVRGLLRLAAGTGEEARSAQEKADALIAKYRLTEDDLDADNDEPNQYVRQFKKRDRLEREAIDALARLAYWLGQEEQAFMRRISFYDRIENQLKLMKTQLKPCGYCREDGFGDKGLTERYHTGFRNNRKVYDDLHPRCWQDWKELQRRLAEKHAGKS
jgi:hypothetical protein